jgi:methyl-accepting chemotaxis protein
MLGLRLFRFKSVRTKLIVLFVLIGVIPAALVATISYTKARTALIESMGVRLQALAAETTDKLDRMFFERSGDVMIFTANPDAAGTPEKVTEIANFFVEQYDVYDLMLVTDMNGTIIAANSKDQDGKPANTSALIGKSVQGEEWFEKASKMTLDQRYISDVVTNPQVASATNSNGNCVIFASTVPDAEGKPIRVWANFVSWDRTANEVMDSLDKRRTERGAKTASGNILSKAGVLLVDGDKERVMKFNLAQTGLEAATNVCAGNSGYTVEANSRTGILQLNGYSACKGYGDYAGSGWGVLVRQDASEGFAAANALAIFVAILMGGMALGIAAIAYFVARSFARPLVATAGALEQIAAGDLTRRVEIESRDEIGLVGECVNKLAGSLQEVVKKIVGSSRELASSSEELSSTATEMAKSADGTTRQSATVAAAAEEMATNMRSMAAGTEEMSSNIKTVAAAIEELTASVSEIARNAESSSNVANQAADLANVSNDKVRQLGEAANEIGKVIDVIQDIADQTNLLALNATIEAARAGEAGKGFAVVATEVKELAKQSAAATDSIRQRIQGMQGSTTDTVKAIAEISTAIRNVNEVAGTIAKMVDQQSTATQEISRNIVQTSEAAASVSRGVTESASACQEITKTIVGVDEAAKSTAAGATQTKSSGAQLSQLAESLQGLVVEFRV